MRNIFLIAVVFFAGALLFRFGGPILDSLRRFDARNAARRREEFHSRFDPHAHYRQTLRLAEDQVEEVTKIMVPDSRTGIMVPRYVFLGVQFASDTEAQDARRAAVTEKARAFYTELDRLWLKPRQERDTKKIPPIGGP
ncbi:MAG: hypothetical protein IID54_01960 [Proteobacteria bacterium]|nr:hypothetical protein [Pseudomonadota bacterium]